MVPHTAYLLFVFSLYRDNVDDFIAANRFSDMLVNVNLDETPSSSVCKTSLKGVGPSSMSGSVHLPASGM